MAKRRTKQDMQKAANTCRLFLLSDNNPHTAYEQYIKDHMLSGQPMPYYIQGIKDFITASKLLESDILAIKKEKERSENQLAEKQSDMELIKSLDVKLVMQAYKTSSGNAKLELCNLANMVHAKDFTGITQSEIYTAKEFQLIKESRYTS